MDSTRLRVAGIDECGRSNVDSDAVSSSTAAAERLCCLRREARVGRSRDAGKPIPLITRLRDPR
ncbi:hypothetical protein C486_05155 [Natrinema gari JCM 14663]|uniref:Uncharacterized protein n=1 Tax=Natrinema gari JCM 14663 TaxID=1230459 RepID=L9Z7J9_9EURY|nr:hypothetical protein C486_05155 [Natrinema gari JCM 14663]